MTPNGGIKSNCKGCNNNIEHGSIVQFGNGVWHLNCFRCVKCSRNIEPDSNLLLLSDGSPLCSNCSQHCCVCKLPISDEAVMTADQCYHAECFRCTKCDSKIDGSLFARTSNGIFCMSCYAERKEQQKKRAQANISKNAKSKEKSLPSIPVEALFNLASPEPFSPTVPHPETTPLSGYSKPVGFGYKDKAENNSAKAIDSPFLSAESPGEQKLSRKPTYASVNSNSSIEQSYSSFYVDGLLSDIKSLQAQLADSEFNYSKLKLHSDQVNERIKIFQEEFAAEISRRKTAEQNLQKLEEEHREASDSLAQITLKVSQLESRQNLLLAEISSLEKKKESLILENTLAIKKSSTIKEFKSSKPNNQNGSIHRSNSNLCSSSVLKDNYSNHSPLHHANSLESIGYIKNLDLDQNSKNNPDSTLISKTAPINIPEINSSISAHPNNEDSYKSRLSSIRRSLDVRSLDKNIKSASKRASMDDISIHEFLDKGGLLSPSTPSLSSSSPAQAENILPNRTPTLSDSNKRDNKRFNWRNAFRINNANKGEQSNNDSIKAQISGPVEQVNAPKVQPSTSPLLTPYQAFEGIKSKSNETINQQESDATNTTNQLSPKSSENIKLEAHQFVNHNYLRPIKCDTCKEKMWGLQAREQRCSVCGYHSHTKCVPNTSLSCPGQGNSYHSLENQNGNPNFNSQENLTKISSNHNKDSSKSTGEPCTIFGVELERQLEFEAPRTLPLIVDQCVQAVENKGMELEGIYRKSGPQTNMKSLRQKLTCNGPKGAEIDFSVPEFRDITVVTSVLKQYFRELPVPLFTFKYHSDWLDANSKIPEERSDAFAEVIKKLPKAHKSTLIFFFDHLNRVLSRKERNLMNSKNLGVVFGPTLMRNSDERLDFDEMAHKNYTIENLLNDWENVKQSLELS